jgi:NTP pyrophosphatase (non-canonical NTP hydrolase)
VRDIYKRALEFYGEAIQFDMLQEECAEVIVAVNHFRRKRITVDELAAEIADVENMCRQVALIVGRERIDAHIAFKLKRLEERMDSK